MQPFIKWIISILPFLIIGGLLYSALFVKPNIVASSVRPPAIARGDYLYGIALPKPNVMWAAGSNGKVWRSADSGLSWAIQATPTDENLQDVAAWDEMRAVAVGNQGVTIRTDDGGKIWREIHVPRSNIANKLMRVKIFEDESAWAVGEGGVVVCSADRGVTWVRKGREEDVAWNDVFVSGQKVWLVGEFGRISSSSDGGETWKPSNSPVKTSLMAIAFRDKTNGVAVGLDGVVLVTRDGGSKWIEQPKVTREHLFDVIWDGSQWAAVGDKGVLVSGDGSGSWKLSQVARNQRAWHTKIVSTEEGYVVTGATLVTIDKSVAGTIHH